MKSGLSPLLILDGELWRFVETWRVLWRVVNLIVGLDDWLDPLLTPIKSGDSDPSDLHSTILLRHVVPLRSLFTLLRTQVILDWSYLLVFEIHQCLSLTRPWPFSKLLYHFRPARASLWPIRVSDWVVLIKMCRRVFDVSCVEWIRMSTLPLIRKQPLSWSFFSHAWSVLQNFVDPWTNRVLLISHRSRDDSSRVPWTPPRSQSFRMSPLIPDELALQLQLHQFWPRI